MCHVYTCGNSIIPKNINEMATAAAAHTCLSDTVPGIGGGGYFVENSPKVACFQPVPEYIPPPPPAGGGNDWIHGTVADGQLSWPHPPPTSLHSVSGPMRSQ